MLLCDRCKALRLTPESFRVTQSEHNRPRQKNDPSSRWLASGAPPIRYALSETGSECRLCSLIRQSIDSGQVDHATGNAEGDAGDVSEYFLQWDLDGPFAEDASKFVKTIRRLKVSWVRKVRVPNQGGSEGGDAAVGRRACAKEAEIKEEIYLLPVDPSPQPPPDATSNNIQRTSHTPENHTESLILRWLGKCKDEHLNPHPLCEGQWKRNFGDVVESTFFGVIDVVEKRLRELPIGKDGNPEPYIALSYVWGQKKERGKNMETCPKEKALHTTSENVLERIRSEGLKEDWSRLPPTILDALKLVEALGRQDPRLRYVWIDSLCIVQDRPNSWNYNAKHMALIYGNAHFTICAADGKSAMTGLAACNPGGLKPPQITELAPGVCVKVVKSSDSLIDASEWNHRGWTYQERILSRRCVIFVGGQVYFQCRQTNWSQDDNPDEAGHGMTSAWRVLLHRSYAELETKPIKFFMTAVETYTGRNLTYASDILDAFTGVSQLVKWYLCSHLHFGLPASHFDLALLWRPLAGKSRRKSPLLTPGPRGGQDVEFPSWSWCGWMDSSDQGKGARAVYDAEFLGGFIDDNNGTRDWLLNHTWIVWYVRGREGNLLPLWDGPIVPPSNRGNMENKWLGYKSRPRGKASCWVRHLDVAENIAIGEGVDDYGRPVKKHRWWYHLATQQQPHHFVERLPDNPFGVRGPTAGDPYQPILQFWTLSCEFVMIPDEYSPAGHDLQRYHVVDRAGDKCGSVVVDKRWGTDEREKGTNSCRFIALSEARNFTQKEWSGSWTYYNGKERDGLGWSLFYVMAIEKDEKRGVWERLGLGKVFQLAFEKCECSWDEIVLG
ncbi:heterokaryon incompatibility protein-domain-containing protein [Podospora aff. communis PSN243]|uniref:Heterokaryon incompatibility protein-domain-containing protein n=1 Tax=Podospora aff. communis PSN243 TaxID=3040156 RepID=A0AAV9GP27_9PEZI|nr:heterokaryon incompatibility protein-domain-containing protein [Podospora aff. communis PSN243]